LNDAASENDDDLDENASRDNVDEDSFRQKSNSKTLKKRKRV
jgi:hypothetical protein